MVALSVYTLGGALVAGQQAWVGAAGDFFTKFVAGGKAFLGSLTGMGAKAGTTTAPVSSSDLAGTVSAAAEQSAQVANVAGEAGGVLSQAKNAADLASSGSSLTQTAGAAAQQATQQGGLLSKIGRGAWDFAKSEGGSNIIGKAVEGYGAAKAEEEMYKRKLKEQRRYDRMWEDVSDTPLGDPSIFKVNVPGGYLSRAQRVAEDLNTRDYRYPSTYEAPVPAAQGA
jgi:hypothetical protein